MFLFSKECYFIISTRSSEWWVSFTEIGTIYHTPIQNVSNEAIGLKIDHDKMEKKWFMKTLRFIGKPVFSPLLEMSQGLLKLS